MEQHPSVVLVGSWYRQIPDLGWHNTLPKGNGAIQYAITFHNPFLHSSVLFRREVVGAGYPTALRTSHDFAFLSHLCGQGQVKNLPEVLSLYRVHPLSLSGQQKEQQNRNAIAILKANIERRLPEASEEESDALARASFFQKTISVSPEELRHFHQKLLLYFLDRFPKERAEIQKIARYRIVSSRETFFGSSLCERLRKLKVILFFYYWRWPKIVLFKLFSLIRPTR